jgi:uncharacterized membrane protein YfcA
MPTALSGAEGPVLSGVEGLVFLAAVMGGGALAGGLGALLGIGGGVFLVPFLTLALGVPIRQALAASLVTVIATSTAVSSGSGRHLINERLGLVLEVATVGGSLVGGLTAAVLSPSMLHAIFAVCTFGIAMIILMRLDVRNVILDRSVDPGTLGGRFYEEETGQEVIYQVRRLPLAIVGSFAAGNLSTLLGIGGGIMKVPLLNAFCGVPIRPAAATSAFMIGVTATSGAVIYFGRGDLVPVLAAAAVLGVRLGSGAGVRLGADVGARRIKQLMAGVLVLVSALMLTRVA